MSIELLTDTASGIARPKTADPTGETSAAKRTAQREREIVADAGSVKLDATKEMDDLVRIVRQAPTDVSEARLADLAMQVRNGSYRPNLERVAQAILDELDMLPDPPYDTLP
jgi:anti-sigma28 factor (negative regulator of flagellin synthesis)